MGLLLKLLPPLLLRERDVMLMWKLPQLLLSQLPALLPTPQLSSLLRRSPLRSPPRSLLTPSSPTALLSFMVRDPLTRRPLLLPLQLLLLSHSHTPLAFPSLDTPTLLASHTPLPQSLLCQLPHPLPPLQWLLPPPPPAVRPS